jgi:transcription antitermination factor NusG
MFPGYLFLRHRLNLDSVAEVSNTRGLMRILGTSWDRLAVVPESQMEAVYRVHRHRLPAQAHPYLRAGQRVRVTSGVLAGMEGILVANRASKGLLVISIDILQRSVAVELDGTLVAAA